MSLNSRLESNKEEEGIEERNVLFRGTRCVCAPRRGADPRPFHVPDFTCFRKTRYKIETRRVSKIPTVTWRGRQKTKTISETVFEVHRGTIYNLCELLRGTFCHGGGLRHYGRTLSRLRPDRYH